MSNLLMYPLYGNPVDFNDISNLVPDMGVISHSLAMQNRWSGNTSYYWSVANHCMHAVEIFKKSFSFFNIKEYSAEYYYVMLRLLLHDAGEAYTGDINAYLKQAVPELRDICDAVQDHVADYFVSKVVPGTLDIAPEDADHIVHTIDRVCGWAEVRTIANENCPFYNFVEGAVSLSILNASLDSLWRVVLECNEPHLSRLKYKSAFVHTSESLSRLH